LIGNGVKCPPQFIFSSRKKTGPIVKSGGGNTAVCNVKK